MDGSLHSALSNLLGGTSSESDNSPRRPGAAATAPTSGVPVNTSTAVASSSAVASSAPIRTLGATDSLHGRISSLESQLQHAVSLLEGVVASQAAAADAAKASRKQMRQMVKHYEALSKSYTEMAAAMLPPDVDAATPPSPAATHPPPVQPPPPSISSPEATSPPAAAKPDRSAASSQSQSYTPASTGSPSLPDTFGVVPPGASAQSRAAAASRAKALAAVQGRSSSQQVTAVDTLPSSGSEGSPPPSAPSPPPGPDEAAQRDMLPATLEVDSKAQFGIKNTVMLSGKQGWMCSIRFYNLPVINVFAELKYKVMQGREPAYHAPHKGWGSGLFTMLLRLDYWRVRGNDFPRDKPPPLRSGELPPPECPGELTGSRPDQATSSATAEQQPVPDGKAARSWVLYTSASLWKAFLKHTGFVTKPAMSKRSLDVCWDLQWSGPTPVMMENAAEQMGVTCTYENWREVYQVAAHMPLQHEPLPWEPRDSLTVHDDDSNDSSSSSSSTGKGGSGSSSQSSSATPPPTLRSGRRGRGRGKKRRRDSSGGSGSGGGSSSRARASAASAGSAHSMAGQVRSALEAGASSIVAAAPLSPPGLPQREGRIQPAVKDKEKVHQVAHIAVPSHGDMSALDSQSAQLRLLPPSLRLPQSTQLDRVTRRWTIRRPVAKDEATLLYKSGGMLLCKLLPPTYKNLHDGITGPQARYMHEVTGQTVFSTALRLDYERLRAGVQPEKLLAQAQRAAANASKSMNLTADDEGSCWIIELLPVIAKHCVQIVDPMGLGAEHWVVQWSGPTPGQLEAAALKKGILLSQETFLSVLRTLKASNGKSQ